MTKCPWIGVPTYIFENQVLLSAWCKGFLKGFGNRKKDVEWLKIVRVCRGRGREWGKVMVEKRGIRILSIAREKPENEFGFNTNCDKLLTKMRAFEDGFFCQKCQTTECRHLRQEINKEMKKEIEENTRLLIQQIGKIPKANDSFAIVRQQNKEVEKHERL